MAITFMLKDKNRETSPIIACVRFRGAQFRRPVGESVPVQYWNSKKRRCNAPRGFSEAVGINATLAAMDAAILGTLNHFAAFRGVPDPAAFWREFESRYYPGYTGEPVVCTAHLTDRLAAYIEDLGSRIKMTSRKKYTTSLSKLREFETERRTRIALSGVDIDFYHRFRDWFFARGYAGNYFGAVVTVIKTIVRDAAYHGLCDTRGIDHRDFKVINQDADNIYLTGEELDAIFRLDISAASVKAFFGLSGVLADRKVQSLRLVRDRFILGAFTGLRVSDFSRVDSVHIGERTISIRTLKPDKPAVIPIHPHVREMLARGFDPSARVSDQKMNEHIKEIARMAGITDEVLITENKGGRPVDRLAEKCDLVCTHTARRSFATNAYKAGIPTIAIMKITGHTKESTFLKYIRISQEENAEMLAAHPFFGGSI